LALFAGYGGLEIGIDAAFGRVRTVGFVERDSYSASTLVARMEEKTLDQAPVWDDATTFNGRPWRGVVDIISAGFPCQPFSMVGRRLGIQDERWLWPDIERVIGEVRPRWFVGENVPGLANRDGGLSEVLWSLSSLGYDAVWGCFRADEVGASHRRERLFILAKLADSDSEGLQRRRRESVGQEGRQVEDGQGGGCSCPIFAPKPEEVGVWRELLARSPEVEPSICRISDGATERLDFSQDRLRSCGNGVVPLQAAFAIRSLAIDAGWQLT
jgi:DNA (cytosine-5)-methyltransferase 1